MSPSRHWWHCPQNLWGTPHLRQQGARCHGAKESSGKYFGCCFSLPKPPPAEALRTGGAVSPGPLGETPLPVGPGAFPVGICGVAASNGVLAIWGGLWGGHEPPEHRQEMGTPRCHPSGGPVPAACWRLSTFPALAARSSGHVPSNPISSSCLRRSQRPRAHLS